MILPIRIMDNVIGNHGGPYTMFGGRDRQGRFQAVMYVCMRQERATESPLRTTCNHMIQAASPSVDEGLKHSDDDRAPT